jgi:hypothetical protein
MMRCWLALMLAACAAHAQPVFTLSDLNVSPPLTAMSGGDFTAEAGMAGDSAILAAGGDFALEGAVTPLSIAIVSRDIALFLAIEGDSLVLTWPDGGAGFVLESTIDLGWGVWTPVQPAPTQRRFVTPLSQPAVFFRLRRP